VKVASFTVHATAEQSRRWKIAAEGEGHRSAGSWLAAAADTYLRLRAKAGLPIPLSWRLGTFRVLMKAGEATLRGFTSEPFHAFRGTAEGPGRPGSEHYSLVYDGRIVATLRTYGQVRELASELAPVLLRGKLPADPASIVERHIRESV
jgi:hypothetical protein